MLLPTTNGLAVHSFRQGGRVERLWGVPGTDVTTARISNDGDRLGVLDQAGKRATVYRLTPGGPERLAVPLALPKRVEGDVIAMKGPVLYVATRGTPPAVYALIDGGWAPRVLPKTIHKPGKRIDELLVDGDRLVAVDDFITPKYFITCDIADDGTVGEGSLIDLPVRTAYERVRFAALGERWVAVLSGGYDGTSGSEHLALFDRATLQERACISRPLWLTPNPVHALIENLRLGMDDVCGLFGIAELDAAAYSGVGSATWRDLLSMDTSAALRGGGGVSEGRRVNEPEPARSRDSGARAKVPSTGLAFGADEQLHIGCGTEGLAVLHLGGHAPGDIVRRDQRVDWDPRAPVAMTRLKLEAAVEGVVTVPGERGCFAVFPGARFRWVDEAEFAARGTRIERSAIVDS